MKSEERGSKSKPVIKLNIYAKVTFIWPGISSSKGIVACSTELLNDVAAIIKRHRIIEQFPKLYIHQFNTTY